MLSRDVGTVGIVVVCVDAFLFFFSGGGGSADGGRRVVVPQYVTASG